MYEIANIGDAWKMVTEEIRDSLIQKTHDPNV